MTLSHFLPSLFSSPPSLIPSACVCGCLTHQRPNWSMLWQIEEDTKNAAVINGDKPRRFHKQVSANFYPMCRQATERVDRGSRYFQVLGTCWNFIQKLSLLHRKNYDDYLHQVLNHRTLIRNWPTNPAGQRWVCLAVHGEDRPCPEAVHHGLPWQLCWSCDCSWAGRCYHGWCKVARYIPAIFF